jgi:hypothetical protein
VRIDGLALRERMVARQDHDERLLRHQFVLEIGLLLPAEKSDIKSSAAWVVCKHCRMVARNSDFEVEQLVAKDACGTRQPIDFLPGQTCARPPWKATSSWTCTPSREPYLGLDDVRPGTFIAAVGADEIHPELMARAIVVAEDVKFTQGTSGRPPGSVLRGSHRGGSPQAATVPLFWIVKIVSSQFCDATHERL